jgi:integrase
MPKRQRKSRCWNHTEGSRGFTVTVEEREPGGIIYARTFDQKLAGGQGGYRRKSLRHRDRELARLYALDQAAKLRQGKAELAAEKAVLARVFALYSMHRTPRKCASEQQADGRRVKMWTHVLGGSKDPSFISPHDWEQFIDQRRTGTIDGRGLFVAEKDRTPVGNRVVEADCLWLRWTLNWATRWRYTDGRRLLEQNGTVGLEVPTEKNPKRPVANDDRYEATRAVSDEVTMEIRLNGRRTIQRSYVSEMLDIANGTARRITAICGLRYQDFRLEPTRDAPHGGIRWPEDTDKEGREWLCPMNPTVRAAINRILQERPGIGAALVFPSSSESSKPVSKDLASEWLVAAERLAGYVQNEERGLAPIPPEVGHGSETPSAGRCGGGRRVEVARNAAPMLPTAR